MKQKFGTIALFITALSFPFAVLVGKITELYLKHANASSVDITSKSAYTHTSLIAGITILGLFIIVAAIISLIGLKKDENIRLARISLITIGCIVILSLLTYLVQTRINTLEHSYSKKSINTFLQNIAR